VKLPTSRRRIEILLVEDSPTDRLIAIEALRQAAAESGLCVVENGADAMAYLRREGRFKDARRPDLILLDLNLPKKDGREVLAEIKHDPQLLFIPVIVLTTSGAEEDVARAYADYANSFITKPVDFSRFTRVLDVIVAYWFDVVTLPPQATLERLARIARRSPSLAVGVKQERLGVVLLSDDPIVVRDVPERLRDSASMRFSVSLMSSLAELRERLSGVPSDVLLVDLGIGDSEGLEAYRHTRAAAPEAAVIVLTNGDADGELALREGAEDFVSFEDASRATLLRAIRYATGRRQMQRELRRAQRMEAIGQIASGIAHDFNNLLTVLHGHAELLSDLAGSMPIGDAVRGIRDTSERATQLTRQLLAFSQRQALHLEPVDLNRVVSDFSRMLRRVLGGGVRLELRLAPQAPSALADIGLLEQLLLNLAIDARASLPAGGEVVLETGQVTLQEGALPHRDAHAGAFATLTSSDTGGKGRVEQTTGGGDAPSSVNPGPASDSAFGGSALAVVRGLVEQHRGWLQIESTPDAGKRIRIFLPRAPSPPAEGIPASSAPSLRGTEKILLVDDEAPVRQMAKAILGRHGYHVVEARSGADAIGLFESVGGIDLLLTDLVMPGGMSGRELAEALQRRDPNLEVVFTSGYGQEVSASGARALNEGLHFLPKPYSVTRLLGAVRRALDGEPALDPISRPP
jgi:two-component system, cell cycle sensor histidine kinase and response regulator CckA